MPRREEVEKWRDASCSPLSSPLASRDPVPFCFFKSCAKAADIRIACVPPSIEADVALVRISPEEMEELRGKGRSKGEGERSNVLTDLISGRLRCPSASVRVCPSLSHVIMQMNLPPLRRSTLPPNADFERNGQRRTEERRNG